MKRDITMSANLLAEIGEALRTATDHHAEAQRLLGEAEALLTDTPPPAATFRGAVLDALWATYGGTEALADAVIAMPEMQAIRLVLKTGYINDLPQSVIEWVLA